MLAAQFFQAPLAIAVLIYYTITTYCFRLKHVEYKKEPKSLLMFLKTKKRKMGKENRNYKLQMVLVETCLKAKLRRSFCTA